jgi:hypothetical protein
MQGEMECALRVLYVKQFLHEIPRDEHRDSLFLHTGFTLPGRPTLADLYRAFQYYCVTKKSVLV